MTGLAEMPQNQQNLVLALQSYKFRDIIWTGSRVTNYIRQRLVDKDVVPTGMSPDVIVWMLEFLVAQNLAAFTNMRLLILPKSLILDCLNEHIICVRAFAAWKVLNEYQSPHEAFFIQDLFEFLSELLDGALDRMISIFEMRGIKIPLFQRVLQLLFLISLNIRDYYYELNRHLVDFQRYGPDLSPEWMAAVNWELNAGNHEKSIPYKGYIDCSLQLGDPLVVIKRFGNEMYTPHFAEGLPHVTVGSENKTIPISLDEVKNIGKTDTKNFIPNRLLKDDSDKNNSSVTQSEDNDYDELLVENVNIEGKEDPLDDIAGWIKQKMIYLARNAKKNIRYMRSLSLKQRYDIEAKTFFQKRISANTKNNNIENYYNFYKQVVCEVRVDLMKISEQLNNIILKKRKNSNNLKMTMLLDKGLNCYECIQKFMEMLNLKPETHKECDLEWLRGVIQSSRSQAQEGKEILNEMSS